MKTLLSVFCLFGIVCLYGTEMAPVEILDKATHASLTTSFSARVTTLGRGQPTSLSFMYYQNASPGGIVYSSMKPLDENIKTSFLVNEKGRFEIIGDTAIRTDYTDAPQMISPQIPIQKDQNTFIVDGKEVTKEMIGVANFAALEKMAQEAAAGTVGTSEFKNISCMETDYSGHPCYQVKYEYDTPNGLFTCVQVIDVNTFFTYKRQIFNSKGELVSEISYTNVVVNPFFEKDFFQLPLGTKVVVAKTLHDGNQQSSSALDKITPLQTTQQCNAPRLSRAALRRSGQKMRISFFDRLLRRPIPSYAAEALNHLSYS